MTTYDKIFESLSVVSIENKTSVFFFVFFLNQSHVSRDLYYIFIKILSVLNACFFFFEKATDRKLDQTDHILVTCVLHVT